MRIDLKEVSIGSTTARDNAQTSMNVILSETSNSTSAKSVNKKIVPNTARKKASPLVTFGDNNKVFTMGYGKIVSGIIVIDDVELVADLDSTNEDGICYFYTKASIEQSKLWHKKLSHLNYKAINTLVKKELKCTLSEFCKNKGIVQEFSAARTPQQNGVVERKNRILVEAARTMLQDANLPTSFWEEAINTSCYTQNRYLLNKVYGKSPYSIMSKRKPIVKHLHVFGSKCYILKDNSEYVGKFDTKVFKAIFLGYSLERTAYKVYVIDQNKIMESIDVTFDDDKCPGLECLDDNEAEALAFENLNISSDSDEEDEDNAQQMMDEETTKQENHGNESSSQTHEFDSTNSGGEREEGSTSHTNNEKNDEGTSQQTHTRKWDRSHNQNAIIGDPNAGVRTISATDNECLHACFLS
ncbi:hypothetical protein AgCh_004596 [Apium graveolens]